MSDRHDYLALDWVRGEIQETLNQAQQALEAFVDNPNDATRMRFCQTHLHQVYGTLQMVEFYGAALLAEEMEKLARALVERRVRNIGDAQETLMRAILQLPPYLDRVASNRRDLPVVLLPLLNDLRAARGEALLSETALFTPDLRHARGEGRISDTVRNDPRFGQLARKIRQMYQLALVGLARDQDTRQNLSYMHKVLGKLTQITGDAARAPLWRISDALVEGIGEGVIELGSSVKQMLGQVDRCLRELANDGAESLEQPAPVDLIKNLLYYVAKADHDSPRIRSVRERFRLDEALPPEDLVNAERERMNGPDALAMSSVVSALSEEITKVKDALERFVHEGDSDPGSLSPETTRLKQVSDTVAMLGLGQPRALINDQLKVMEEIIAGRRPAARDTLMDVAGALLYVEATLAGIGGDQRRPAPANGGDLPSHVGQAMDAVLRECRAGLEEAKDGIVEFIASHWDRQHLEAVPERLNAVRGGLDVVQLHKPADILRQCVKFIEIDLMEKGLQPDWRSMDTLADAITSVEYYLERLSDDPQARDDILELARNSVAALGYPLTDDEAEATPDPAFDDLEPTSDIPSPDPTAFPEERLSPDEWIAPPADSDDAPSVEFLEEPSAGFDEEPSADLDVEPSADLDVEPSAEFGEQPSAESGEQPSAESAEAPSEALYGKPSAEVDEAPLVEEHPDTPAAQPDAEDDDLIDDEIIEIFVEEAGEVLEALDQYFPRWAANTSDETALVEFRRAFHTLKGSGRMVGASTVGELAWSIENMMNRVIDRSIEPTAQLIELVRTVHGLIPDLVDAFAKRRPAPWDVTPLEEAANTLAAGEALAAIPDVRGETPAAPIPDDAAPALAQDDDPLADLDHLEFDLEPVAERREPADPESADIEGDATEPEPDGGDVDPVLLDIFRSEARRNLELVREWLDGLDPDLSEHAMDDHVHRALHTLKGSARMAEIEAVAELAEPAEKLVKELINSGRNANSDVVELIQAAYDHLNEALDRLTRDPLAPLPDADALIRSLVAARDDLNRGADGTDPHILSVFLAEGMDLIIDADNLLEQWAADPAHTRDLARLRDELERLGDNARHAGLDEIHGLAGALAGCYAAVNRGRLGFSESLLEVVREGHEALMNMMDCLAAGQTVRAELGLVDALRDLAEASGPEGPGPGGGGGTPPTPLSPVDSAPRREPPADLDPEVTGLFLEEAEDLLLSGSEHLAAWEQGETDSLGALQRDLHTLKGGARMAGVAAIGDLAHELESLYETAGDARDGRPAPSFFDTLHRGHDRLAEMVEALRGGEVPEAAPELIGELRRAGRPPSGPAPVEAAGEATPSADEPEAGPPTGDQRDPELVSLFLEEAHDILESAGRSLEIWIGNPDNTLEIQSLQRDLHTLKGGARMAELTSLGDLGHELETLYEAVGLRRVSVHPTLFDLLHRCHDRLAEMVEAVASGAAVRHPTSLIHAIRGYLADPLAFSLEDAVPARPIVPADDLEAPEPPPATPASPGALPEEADPEILDVFLEEAEELTEIIDGCLTAWRDHPESRDFSDDLKRALHTLKGGARLSGLNEVADLTHGFEARVGRLDSERRPPEEPDFEVMLRALDDINRALSSLREATASLPARAESPATVDEPPPVQREERRTQAQPQEMVRVGADVLESLVNLAGETSINRSRVEQSISEFGFNVAEMGSTVTRLYEQLRRLDVETEAQILSNYQKGVDRGEFDDRFDPLEMDQYSELHQITKQLSESASDLLDLKNTLLDRTRDTETLLLQQQRINTELQEKLMRTRMVPFSRLVPRLRRIVRQVSGEVNKRVGFDVINPEAELDRTLMERVVAPLEHMLRNAVDHGIETPEQRRDSGKDQSGRISLELSREGGEVVLTLADDGRGIDTEAVRRKAIERGLMAENAQLPDQEIQQFIFHAGFSTASQVTQLSGRGVGMDVVASEIKQLGGTVVIDSRPGQGTRFIVRLPFTLAMNRALMVKVGEDHYAIPLNQIEGIVRISPYELIEHFQTGTDGGYRYAGQEYDLRYLGRFVHDVMAPNLDNQSQPLPVLLIRSADHSVALVVDNLIGSREVVVKSLGPQLASVAGISGATILGDGAVVIILDIHSLIRASLVQAAPLPARAEGEAPEPQEVSISDDDERGRIAPLVMVVDDSVTVRKVTGRLLERNGYEVITAKDGIDAIATLEDHTPDAMLLDIEMPRMDGFEVATQVRHDERLKGMPIIMITSRTGEKHRERAFDIGVNCYMGKPFQENELLSTLQELLGEAREIDS